MGMGWPVPHRCRIGAHAYILWSDGPVGKKTQFIQSEQVMQLFICLLF